MDHTSEWRRWHPEMGGGYSPAAQQEAPAFSLWMGGEVLLLMMGWIRTDGYFWHIFPCCYFPISHLPTTESCAFLLVESESMWLWRETWGKKAEVMALPLTSETRVQLVLRVLLQPCWVSKGRHVTAWALWDRLKCMPGDPFSLGPSQPPSILAAITVSLITVPSWSPEEICIVNGVC